MGNRSITVMEVKKCLNLTRRGERRGARLEFVSRATFQFLLLFCTVGCLAGGSDVASVRGEDRPINVLQRSADAPYLSLYSEAPQAKAETETRTGGLDAEYESVLPLWWEDQMPGASSAAPMARPRKRMLKLSARPDKRQHNAPGKLRHHWRPNGSRTEANRKWLAICVAVTALATVYLAKARAKRRLRDEVMRKKREAAAASAEILGLLKEIQAGYNDMSEEQKKEFHSMLGIVKQFAESVGEEGRIAELVVAVTSRSPAKVENYVQKTLETMSLDEQAEMQDVIKTNVPLFARMFEKHPRNQEGPLSS